MKNIKIRILATALGLNLLFLNITLAIGELPATPSVLSEPSATLLITEVNFKNKEKDFAVLIYNSPSQKPSNLKGIRIIDDGLIKNIDEDFIVASGQQILLTWNSDQPDAAPYLYTTKKGLTGTTEQLIIYDQNEILLDMVCWRNDAPTETEIEDFNEAYENEGWSTNDINSCIPSNIINNNESITRKNNLDTNSISDWILPIHPEKETPKEEVAPILVSEISKPHNSEPLMGSDFITEEKEENINEEEILIIPKLTSITIPKTEVTASNTTNSDTKVKSTYSNGNLSNEIVISEILPNPEGSDSGKEWIELLNTGQSDINLGNWILDDDEEGSKPFLLPDSLTIPRGQTALIDCKSAKLSLGNTEDSVRLFDFNGQIISEAQYESAPSNESYSLINIMDEEDEITSQYQWTNEQTPGQPNPMYNRFTVTIESEPLFEDKYFFEGKTSKGKLIKVIFTEDIIAAPLAKATFAKGTTLVITVEEQDNNQYRLATYESIGSPQINSSPSGIILPTFLGFLAFAGIALYVATKKINWQLEQKSL